MPPMHPFPTGGDGDIVPLSAWLGACAAPHRFGAGDLKSTLPQCQGKEALLPAYWGAGTFPAWPGWSFSSYLLFHLTVLLVKAISDSCQVLSAGWRAVIFHLSEL